MTTNNNPGVVNVADQAFKPDLKVDSLAVPLDDDVLVPGEQAPGSPSQDFAEVPGVPPLYLPFPPSKADPNVQGRSVTAGTIAEFTVAAPAISIQTNETPATIRDYTVTAVLDADTGGPPTVTTAQVSGSYTSVQAGATGFATFISPTPLLPALAGASALTIAGSPLSPYNGTDAIGNVISETGPFGFAAPSISVGKTTLAFASALPAAMATAGWMTISGSAIPAYNGVQAIVPHSIVSLGGVPSNVSAVVQENGSLTTSTVVAATATALTNGQPVLLSGTGGVPPHGYDGYWTVSNVVNLSGSISSIVNSTPGTSATVNLVGTVPAGLVAGQSIVLAGTPDYDGPAVVLSATTGASSFVIVWTNAASPTDHAGAWSAYTFDIGTPYTGAISSPGQWSCYAIDINVPNTGTASGSWTAYTFDIPYSGSAVTAAGTWQFNPPQVAQTTRYRLFVAPTDLASFGISMLGRQIVFDDVILTVANEGAARLITGYAWNWIVINRNDPDDLVANLSNPQVGDIFSLDTQRQASEVVTSAGSAAVDVNVSTAARPIQGAVNVFV